MVHCEGIAICMVESEPLINKLMKQGCDWLTK